ncbi:hypothetical protein [Alkalicoccobacillus plakortidis]|uniref:HEAT repeat protein n=1 Tax=Alkalicoccobacillus plakortidis TaxID=444060 RepID=A0ABT0XFS6_9BACI|nr:hypothetical protein [Alkalicoccobacillus plakortidis]MCM2674756.1 hypothetical protein [Alkalicoccobacillus plakortidis]
MYGIHQLNSGEKLANRSQTPLLSLKPGQLFSGKVVKHYPEQLAALSIRGMTVIAKLETPVTAGSSYWFMVREGQDLPRLQIVQPDSPQTTLLPEALGGSKLPTSKEAHTLINQLKTSGIPFSLNQLTDGINLLKTNSVPSKIGMETIGSMIRQQLPLTSSVYHALASLQQTDGLTNSLEAITQAFKGTNKAESVDVLQSMLQRTQGPTTRSPIDHLIRTVIDPNTDQESKQAAIRVLAKLEWPQITPTTTSSELLTKWNVKDASSNGSLLDQILPNRADQKEIHVKWATIFEGISHAKEKEIIQSALRHSVSQTVVADGKQSTFANQLIDLIKLVGYQDEANLHDVKTTPPSIKNILIQLMNDGSTTEVRSQAEQALHKITGHQIQSLPSDSFLHLLIQLPIKLGEYQTDMTMQWQGKKQEDGTLNPDNCRLLFFLELERIKETMIQVTIQEKGCPCYGNQSNG